MKSTITTSTSRTGHPTSQFFFLLSLDRPFSVSRLYRYTFIFLFHLFTPSSLRPPTPSDTTPPPPRHKDPIRPPHVLFHLDTVAR